ncbi:GNAT family N-acetyltransferase [Brevibacillus migulae]|uniref:GNAT family N-acetyltransferase n=1 Tax=Brevibacillus migulae TaxID=1644114 RepID=UPI00106E6B98|nr:GNAT family N-acetyltransferase [Brevibacillus migulae]
MEIRMPTTEEMETIRKLSPQAMKEGTMGSVLPTDEKVKQMVEPLLEKGGYYLAAIDDGNVAGWVLLGPSKDSFTDAMLGFIYELYVCADYRGRGISRQLMQSGIEQLKQAGYEEIRLNVFIENDAAIHLYRQLGFTERNITMSVKS